MQTELGRQRQIALRKFRKLLRDPRAFARDSRFFRTLGTSLSLAELGASGESRKEPRLLVRIQRRGAVLSAERFERKIAEPDLATIICYPDDANLLSDQPILGAASRRPEFVGFRDRYLFGLCYDESAAPRNVQDPVELLEALRGGERTLLAGIRNLVFLNPVGILPHLLRATSPDVRLIIFVTDPELDLDVLREHADQIDVLVVSDDVPDRVALRGVRTLKIPAETDLVEVLQELVVEHKAKEKSAFIPVFGEPEYVWDIDALLRSNVDIVWRVEPRPDCSGCRTFADLVEKLAQNTRWLLVREEQYHRYRDLCEQGDLKGLLLMSLKDGCRHDLR